MGTWVGGAEEGERGAEGGGGEGWGAGRGVVVVVNSTFPQTPKNIQRNSHTNMIHQSNPPGSLPPSTKEALRLPHLKRSHHINNRSNVVRTSQCVKGR